MTGGELEQVACATAALFTMEHLRAGRRDEATAVLDSTIDSGIARHWLLIRNPSYQVDTLLPSTELVDLLVEHRRANPSSAATETPNLDRAVSEYLAYRDSRDDTE